MTDISVFRFPSGRVALGEVDPLLPELYRLFDSQAVSDRRDLIEGWCGTRLISSPADRKVAKLAAGSLLWATNAEVGMRIYSSPTADPALLTSLDALIAINRVVRALASDSRSHQDEIVDMLTAGYVRGHNEIGLTSAEAGDLPGLADDLDMMSVPEYLPSLRWHPVVLGVEFVRQLGQRDPNLDSAAFAIPFHLTVANEICDRIDAPSRRITLRHDRTPLGRAVQGWDGESSLPDAAAFRSALMESGSSLLGTLRLYDDSECPELYRKHVLNRVGITLNKTGSVLRRCFS